MESIAKPTTRPARRNFREDKRVTEFDGSSRYKAMHQNNNIGVSVEITALPRETAGINAHNNNNARSTVSAEQRELNILLDRIQALPDPK